MIKTLQDLNSYIINTLFQLLNGRDYNVCN